jgi:hypothetical protein
MQRDSRPPEKIGGDFPMSPPVSQAMSNVWFDKIGLLNLTRQRALLNV